MAARETCVDHPNVSDTNNDTAIVLVNPGIAPTYTPAKVPSDSASNISGSVKGVNKADIILIPTPPTVKKP